MDEILRAMVDTRDRVIQKTRIAFGNRLEAIKRGDDQVDPYTHDMIDRWHSLFNGLEKEITQDIDAYVDGDEVVEMMSEVPGIGPLTAAKIVAMVDIERADTISSLWRYAGYGVVDGKAERLVKGEPAHFNTRLKGVMGQTGSLLIRKSNPYRPIYDEAVAYYQENRDWSDGHVHYAALRKVIKLFLSHLWVRWRELEGLPVSDPYIIDQPNNHTHVKKPADYGWPE